MRIQLAGLMGLMACSGSPSTPAVEDAVPVLRIGGAPSLMTGLLPALTETHARTRRTLEFSLSPSSDDAAFQALIDGELDLAAVTRPANPVELERAAAKKLELSGESRTILAVDVTAVAVHPDNPVASLSYDQVIGVFCTQTVDDWSFLGQPEQPIRAMTLAPSSGDRALFEDFFCGPRGIHASVVEGTPEEIDEALASDPTVVTYTSMSRGVGKLVALQPDSSGPAVEPSQQNIIRGSYPLYRDVYLVSSGPAAGYTRSFLDWIASPAGQDVVDEQRFVPLFLRPDRMDEPRPLRETIHFEPGRSVPNQRSMARLRLLVSELQERKLDHVVLEGFTDDRESDPLGLSEKRANAVRELLMGGLPDIYFEIIPRGPALPLAPNDTPYGRQRNRRVQVYIASEERRSADDVVVESGEAAADGG